MNWTDKVRKLEDVGAIISRTERSSFWGWQISHPNAETIFLPDEDCAPGGEGKLSDYIPDIEDNLKIDAFLESVEN